MATTVLRHQWTRNNVVTVDIVTRVKMAMFSLMRAPAAGGCDELMDGQPREPGALVRPVRIIVRGGWEVEATAPAGKG